MAENFMLHKMLIVLIYLGTFLELATILNTYLWNECSN